MKPYWLWDNDLDEEEFVELLSGRKRRGRRDQTWAAVRLLDYAPYRDIRRLVKLKDLKEHWPQWRARVRSVSRRRGVDFLVSYLDNHPEKISEQSR